MYIFTSQNLWSNSDVGSTEQELINIFKHKIYSFCVYRWLIFHRQSHSIIQFIAACFSKKWPKLLVLVSVSHYSKLKFSITINQLVRFWLIYMDNVRKNVCFSVVRYPTIKIGTRKFVSKRIMRGINGRRTGMRTQ